MAEHNFSFKIRQAEQAARAVATEINNATRFGGAHEGNGTFVPSCLSISEPETKNEVIFRYEGGTVVRVYMFDLGALRESWRTPHTQEWAIYRVYVRYYPRDPKTYRQVGEGKVEEIWGAERLAKLQKRRPFETRIVDGVNYRVLVKGDLEKAKATAQQRLKELLRAAGEGEVK